MRSSEHHSSGQGSFPAPAPPYPPDSCPNPIRSSPRQNARPNAQSWLINAGSDSKAKVIR